MDSKNWKCSGEPSVCTRVGCDAALGGHCYWYVGKSLNWASARAACQAFPYKGYLVAIQGSAENSLVFELGNGGWIGLSDSAQEGTFVWVSESGANPPTYFNWAPGEPNNAGGVEDCTHQFSLVWNDINCADSIPFVCERNELPDIVCSDGLLQYGETCDDGNKNGGDGCSSGCAVEAGYACSGEPSVCGPVCGDGVIKGSEGCDDGNKNNGDGCSSNCGVEAKWACSGQPSSCWRVCANGGSYWSGNGHCYRYEPTPVNRDQASVWCAQKGGYLATPTSSAENEKIRSMLGATGWFGIFKDVPFPWGLWRYVDGSPEQGQPIWFTAWNPGEPNGDGLCAEMYTSGTWNDTSCYYGSEPSVCEWTW